MQLASVSAGGKGHREETADGDKNDVVFDASDAGRGKILNNLIKAVHREGGRSGHDPGRPGAVQAGAAAAR